MFVVFYCSGLPQSPESVFTPPASPALVSYHDVASQVNVLTDVKIHSEVNLLRAANSTKEIVPVRPTPAEKRITCASELLPESERQAYFQLLKRIRSIPVL